MSIEQLSILNLFFESLSNIQKGTYLLFLYRGFRDSFGVDWGKEDIGECSKPIPRGELTP